jgi:hypothetical protein
MMHAGLFEGRPRSRELVYVMLGQRAARALGDLHMHDNTWTLEQASEFASKATPRGWLRLDGRTVRGEQLLWLRRPSYGTTYIVGKAMTDELIARMSRNGPLPMKALLDGLNRTGPHPHVAGRRGARGAALSTGAEDPGGAVRVPASPLEGTIEFLERLGFRLEEIAPADDPSEALMTGHGLRLKLDRAHHGAVELLVPAASDLPPAGTSDRAVS